MKDLGAELYERLGISQRLSEYVKTLPQLNEWQVVMREDGRTAEVKLNYTRNEEPLSFNFTFPTHLSFSHGDLLPCRIASPPTTGMYSKFLKHKSVVDTLVGLSAGWGIFSTPLQDSVAYIKLFLVAVSVLYFIPSLVRVTTRFFLEHPVNRIHHIASLLLNHKEDDARKEIQDLTTDNGYMALRGKLLEYSPYDPKFSFKYFYVNATIACALGEYDLSTRYFQNALRLARSEKELFSVGRDYINMLGQRHATIFENEINSTLESIPKGRCYEIREVLLKEKLMAVLSALIGHEGKEAAALMDDIRWGKSDEKLYPHLASLYYALKQTLLLCDQKIGHHPSLDIESGFRQAMDYQKLALSFSQKCGEVQKDIVSLHRFQ